MATTKQRILITLTPEMARELSKRAKAAQTPRATIAAHLLHNAIHDISDEEDRYLSVMGDKIFSQTKRWYTHKEVLGKRVR